MRVGQARKRDTVEAAIVSALREIGVTVLRISGAGAPDLLCHARGVWLPIEVKHARPRRVLTDTKSRSLTPAQCLTYAVAPFPIVTSVADALSLFGIRR